MSHSTNIPCSDESPDQPPVAAEQFKHQLLPACHVSAPDLGSVAASALMSVSCREAALTLEEPEPAAAAAAGRRPELRPGGRTRAQR